MSNKSDVLESLRPAKHGSKPPPPPDPKEGRPPNGFFMDGTPVTQAKLDEIARARDKR